MDENNLKLPLSTNRLIIRPFRDSDFSKFIEGIRSCREEQSEFDSFALQQKNLSSLTRDIFKTFPRIDPQNVSLQLFSKDETEWIGTIDIYNIKRRCFQSANIDYILLNHFWGQGLAQEALAAVVPFAFGQLQLHRLEATIEEDNSRSLGLVERLGLQFEGIRRDGVKRNGIWRNLRVYARVNQ